MLTYLETTTGQSLGLPSKIVCVGRNYVAHAKELNNPVPANPLLFLKPNTTLIDFHQPFTIPMNRGAVHYELEAAVYISNLLKNADDTTALNSISHVGLAFDLTLRTLQEELKKSGHPWEKSKSFDGACPISTFYLVKIDDDLDELSFNLKINGERRQYGQVKQMITPIVQLVSYASSFFTLLPGDIILTGTPAGVGELQRGDNIEAELSIGNQSVLQLSTTISS